MDELRWFFSFLIVGVFGLTVMVTSSQYFEYLKNCEALKNGYSQQTVQGEQGVYWVKNGEVMK